MPGTVLSLQNINLVKKNYANPPEGDTKPPEGDNSMKFVYHQLNVTVFRLLGDVIHQQAENKQILVLRLKFKTLMDCLYVLWIQIITKIFFHSFMVHKIAMFLHQKNYQMCLGPLKFIYPENATKFCEVFTLLLTVRTVVKS